MPNHVENDLYVRGPAEDLKRFKEEAQGIEGLPDKDEKERTTALLSAHTFIPYPKTFVDGERCKACGGMERDPEKTWACKACGGQVTDGYNRGGYEWCIEHWGTKWGLYDVKLVEEDYEYESLKYTFRSAWSPPIPVIEAMAKKYPTLEFLIEYFECGMGYQGGRRYANGECVNGWDGDYWGSRGG
jgi:hypothetical protein